MIKRPYIDKAGNRARAFGVGLLRLFEGLEKMFLSLHLVGLLKRGEPVLIILFPRVQLGTGEKVQQDYSCKKNERAYNIIFSHSGFGF